MTDRQILVELFAMAIYPGWSALSPEVKAIFRSMVDISQSPTALWALVAPVVVEEESDVCRMKVLETVAAAIYAKKYPDLDWGDASYRRHNEFLGYADAAVEALQEPTVSMLDAARRLPAHQVPLGNGQCITVPGLGGGPSDVWKAMVGAILGGCE